MTKTWREIARAEILKVRAAHPEASGYVLRGLLRVAYPFGERRMHPYKVWCEEVNKACSTVATPADVKNFWVNMGRKQ